MSCYYVGSKRRGTKDGKILYGLIAGMFVMIFNGYGWGDQGSNPASAARLVAVNQIPSVEDISLAQENSSKEAKKNYSEIGAELMKETVGFLSIGISDSEVLNGLGEPREKSIARFWGADKLEHQSWSYPIIGIELDMVGKEGRQVVDRVSIESPCDFKTKRGIGIGSRTKEVQSAYQNEINLEFSKDDSKIVVGTVYGGIIFVLKDGAVVSIFSGAATE